jgi:hypothetical protein
MKVSRFRFQGEWFNVKVLRFRVQGCYFRVEGQGDTSRYTVLARPG